MERIHLGNRTYYSYVNIKLPKSKLLARGTEVKIHNSLVRPVVTIGNET